VESAAAWLRLLESALDHAYDAIAIAEADLIDPPGPRIVYVNQGFVRQTGYSPEEAIGQTPRMLRGSQTPPEEHARIRQALIAKVPVRAELHNRRKDGSEYWTELWIAPLTDSEGRTTHFISVQRDITQRREMLERLRSSEELHRTILSALSEGVILQDSAGAVRACNAEAERLLGLNIEEMSGRNPFDGADRSGALELLRGDPQAEAGRIDPAYFPPTATLASGRPMSDVELGIRRPGGAVVWLSMNTRPLFHPGETKPYAVVTSFADITERRRMQAELVARERLAAIGQAFASVAHCMKNVFTSLNGAIHLVDAGLRMGEDDKVSAGMDVLWRSSTRLQMLLMEMLDFSKDREPLRREIDLKALFEEVVQMLSLIAAQTGVSIESVVEPGAEVFRLDVDRLLRALLNLGGNAIDAMPQGGQLRLRAYAWREGSGGSGGGGGGGSGAGENPSEDLSAFSAGLGIEVSDTGLGSAEETIKRLFQPFFSTKGSRGTGLGLASVKQFVDSYGGRIEVHTRLGEGTTFRLLFPE